MSSMTNFLIFGKKFKADIDLVEAKLFTIKSIPRPYNVTLDENSNPCNAINKVLSENSNNLLLIDKNVYSLYGKSLKISKNRLFVAEATEIFKTMDGALKVIDFLQKNQVTKKEKLIVVGGGIIQDIGAFAGILYKRGIPWVYFPTTLLSMCDSCIGAKAGLNHGNAKNQLALFSSPREIIININFIKTLSDEAVKAGMGEILKLLLIGGENFIKIYKNLVINGIINNFESYKKLIFAALAVKKSVIEEDEFELDHRRSLNLGHTIGHAVESLSNYKIPHGQAVTIGIIIVNALSLVNGILPGSTKTDFKQLLLELVDDKVKSIMKKLNVKDLTDLLKKDKKTIGNTINFVIIKKPGCTDILSLQNDKALKNEINTIIKSNFK